MAVASVVLNGVGVELLQTIAVPGANQDSESAQLVPLRALLQALLQVPPPVLQGSLQMANAVYKT